MGKRFYERWVIGRPKLTLFFILLLVGMFGYHAPKFHLDASADALVLENDTSLDYYRSIRARYGSDDYLILTYMPNDSLFSDAVIADLKKLRDNLLALPRIETVTSILDVPLISSPPQTLEDLQKEVLTLEHSKVDRSLAEKELLESPLYKNLLIGKDGKVTALLATFKQDATYFKLISQRNALREQKLSGPLSKQDALALQLLSLSVKRHTQRKQAEQQADIRAVRAIMDQHRNRAQLFLGGAPMVIADSVDYIRRDLVTFGIGVIAFIVVILVAAFRSIRWVLLPMTTCLLTGITMVGFLGLTNWPVTVASSNFISLLMIITLSLTIHLIVRYREIHRNNPEASEKLLVKKTVKRMFKPCFYTAITTMVAFGSLLISDIRPVIDFGWMMVIGITFAFILVFSFFPAILMCLPHGDPPPASTLTLRITGFFARLIQQRGGMVLIIFLIMIGGSIWGATYLTVENRFIDYYKKSTEIYQGMEQIDQKLGGTTPLDVIINAPLIDKTGGDQWDDPYAADYLLEGKQDGEADISNGFWYNSFILEDIKKIHTYLESIPQIGKVLSMDTAFTMVDKLNPEITKDTISMAILYNKLPIEMKKVLFTPYISEDGNQIRFSVRVYESDASLERSVLLTKIREFLTKEMQYSDEQIHFSGMLVLYNNLLQSLFHSQIMTIAVVFAAIFGMLLLSFRNVTMALIALPPNMIAVLVVLGILGWFGIALDIMTITIAAICIGIAVDNSIHYVHRFTLEFDKDRDYWAAVKRSHGSIGFAMYYTTITITLGFSILAFSNFVPTIYFGLLTGFAMLVALFANIALLPLLIVVLKPLGNHQSTATVVNT